MSALKASAPPVEVCLDSPALPESGSVSLPEQAKRYPEFRYMGSKRRLLPWIYSHLKRLDFESAADPFLGSGSVAYLLKAMGKKVLASDFLNFPVTLARATLVNSKCRIEPETLKKLLAPVGGRARFIERTFAGIFYTPEDLRFLDRVEHNLRKLDNSHHQVLAKSALIRSCLKRQPRGVFTFSGNRYDDGRRDLRLTIEEHFSEQIEVMNGLVFDNRQSHTAERTDVFQVEPGKIDLVYLDPPYVPRADDNCYVKRYHFLEGLSCYWEGLEIMEDSKVKKIPKRYTPFSYRRTAVEAFDQMFQHFKNSKIVLSYSSNGYPDLDVLERSLKKYKKKVQVFEQAHRYHFGTHQSVERSQVQEYLLIGQ